MQKKIGRRVYDTERAEYVGRNAEGYYGDPTGFEELLYKKALGDFFLFVSGGPESQYPNEDIIPLSLTDAGEWIERVRGSEIVAQFITEADTAALVTANTQATLKKSSAKAKTTKTLTSADESKRGSTQKVAGKKVSATRKTADKTGETKTAVKTGKKTGKTAADKKDSSKA